jgi:hypothetical protein
MASCKRRHKQKALTNSAFFGSLHKAQAASDVALSEDIFIVPADLACAMDYKICAINKLCE